MTRSSLMSGFLRGITRRTMIVSSFALEDALTRIASAEGLLVPLGFRRPAEVIDELLGTPSFSTIVKLSVAEHFDLREAKERLDAARLIELSGARTSEDLSLRPDLRALSAKVPADEAARARALSFYRSLDIILLEPDESFATLSWVLARSGLTARTVEFLSDEHTRPFITACPSVDAEMIALAEAVSDLLASGVKADDIHVSFLDTTHLRSAQEIFALSGLPAPALPGPLSAYPFVRAFMSSLQSSVGRPLYPALQASITAARQASPSSPVESALVTLLSPWIGASEEIGLLTEDHLRLIARSLQETAVRALGDPFSAADASWLFLADANSQTLPRPHQDDDVLRDHEKKSLGLLTSSDLNALSLKEEVTRLSCHGHVQAFYVRDAEADPFSAVFRSIGCTPADLPPFTSCRSRSLARLLFAKERETAARYGSPSPLFHSLSPLFSSDEGKPHDAFYTGMDPQALARKLSTFKLSYSSLETYYECPFKFYCDYILRVDPFTSSAASILGDICHEVLAMVFSQDAPVTDEDIEQAFTKASAHADENNTALEDPSLPFFRSIALSHLKEVIPMIAEWESRTGFSSGEHEVSYECHDFALPLTGKIDKVLTTEINGKTYAVVIDYKTGMPNADIKKIPYGLSMQLFVYFYLLRAGDDKTAPSFAGAYLEHVFPSTPFHADLLRPVSLSKLLHDFAKLNGYSTSDSTVLNAIEPDLKSDEAFIQGLTVLANGEISDRNRGRLLDDEAFMTTLATCKDKISEAAQAITAGSFPIKPAYLKPLQKQNLACSLCRHRDICHHVNQVLDYDEGGDEDEAQ